MHVLEGIREGMKVLDSARHEIGKVEYVKLVDETATGEPVASGLDEDVEHPNSTIIDNIAAAFTSDEVPHEVRERLLHDGFVRLDADGLFASDRYILPSQIAGVTSEGVMLNVTKDQLVKRH